MQFADVRPRRAHERVLKVMVSMDRVVTLDPCAVLNLVAHADRIAKMNRVRIRGNSPPPHTQAYQVLREARFHEYMKEAYKRRPPSLPSSLAIRSGDSRRKLDPTSWLPLFSFLKDNAGLSDSQVEVIYTAFGEAIENVRQHAYRTGVFRNWYALALHPEEGPSRAVIVDLGVGIPASVRRTRLDRYFSAVAGAIRSVLNALGLIEDVIDEGVFDRLRGSDTFCVVLATTGERTETAEPQRGTGLNTLRRTVVDSSVGRLHVLSDRAGVTWNHGSDQPEYQAFSPLLGTTLCLELEPPSEDDNARRR